MDTFLWLLGYAFFIIKSNISEITVAYQVILQVYIHMFWFILKKPAKSIFLASIIFLLFLQKYTMNFCQIQFSQSNFILPSHTTSKSTSLSKYFSENLVLIFVCCIFHDSVQVPWKKMCILFLCFPIVTWHYALCYSIFS